MNLLQKQCLSSPVHPGISHTGLQVAIVEGKNTSSFTLFLSFHSSFSPAISFPYLSQWNQVTYLKIYINCLTFENLFTVLFFPLPCLLYNFDFIEMPFWNIDFTWIANRNGLSWRKLNIYFICNRQENLSESLLHREVIGLFKRVVQCCVAQETEG